MVNRLKDILDLGALFDDRVVPNDAPGHRSRADRHTNARPNRRYRHRFRNVVGEQIEKRDGDGDGDERQGEVEKWKSGKVEK